MRSKQLIEQPISSAIAIGYRSQSSDTSIETDIFECALLRQRSNSDRLQMSAILTQGARQLCLCGLQQTHALLPKQEFAQLLARAFLGDSCPDRFIPTGNEMTWIQDSIALAIQLQSIFERLNIPYYITGGVAASTYGEPRTTRDLDIVIALSLSELDQLVQSLENEGFYVPGVEDMRSGHIQILGITHQETIARADLRKLDFSHASFIGVDLSYANLREADLSYCDLSQTYLNEADLRKANLKGANLTGASLIKTCLIKSNLEAANLNQAYLTEAYLTEANLTEAYLTGAYLTGSKLNGAILKGSYYNDQTHFDIFFDPIKVGMKKLYLHEIPLEEVKITVEELLAVFNYLSQFSSHYLGSSITARNWDFARPNFDWLNNFKMNSSAQMTFSGRLKDIVTTLQLELSQDWVISFVGLCSEVIQDFSSKINQQRLPFPIILSDIDDETSSIFGFLANS